jgi:homogentisate 1,2-dioxygenase
MVDFVDGMVQVCGSGDPSTKHGLCIYNYTANVSMGQNLKRAFYNADGDMLIVPQVGTLEVTTEMGKLHADPCEVIVIPRGIKFAVDVEEPSRGYILEVLKGHFDLPNLGPIGANGLANPRDFEIPVAQFESEVDEQEHEVIAKFGGKFFSYDMDHSPFNVVAWHGKLHL